MARSTNIAEAAPSQAPPDPSRWGFALIATGIPLLSTGGLFLLLGLMITVVVSVAAEELAFSCCTLTLGFLGTGLAIAGGICLYLGRSFRAEGRKLADASSLLRAHRRMSFYKLAGKMGVSEAEAEQVVARCMSLGILEGYIDRTKHEFYTPEAILHTRNVTDCPTCHASVDKLRFLGEEFRCESCGTML